MGRGGKRRENGAKMVYAPGAKNPRSAAGTIVGSEFRRQLKTFYV